MARGDGDASSLHALAELLNKAGLATSHLHLGHGVVQCLRRHSALPAGRRRLCELDDALPLLRRHHTRKQRGERCVVRVDTVCDHQLVGSPSLVVALGAKTAAHQAREVDHGRLHAVLALPAGYEVIGLLVAAASAVQLKHRDESEFRGLYAARQHVLEELLAKSVVAGVAASLEEMGQDDVVRLVTSHGHVINEAEGLVELVLINKSLDEHRIRDDVRVRALAALHLLVQLQCLWDAVGAHEAFDEERAHHSVHWAVALHQQVDNLTCCVHVVVYDASIEESAEGDVVRLDALIHHLVQALEALGRQAAVREALDHGVVGHHVHDNYLLALPRRLFEAMRLAEEVEPTLRLPGVGASQKHQVEHQGRGLTPQPAEDRLCGVNIVERHVCAEEEHMVLGLDLYLLIAIEQSCRAVWGAHLQCCIDEAREDDLI
mmetsp:Transcript_46721/g.117657  ORF Transcript_46721/g.117657 Transcript_46721/m.117657 type:complete len:433 (+) Transcript_46721:211-1509(+)